MIPVAKPWLGEEEAAAVNRVLATGWITQGPEVAAFEKEFAAYVGAPHACAVSNCTTALHLALLVAGVGPGDEVITVSHSFIATANAIRYCGATPVFVDIDPDTFNLDPALIERTITGKTKAVLCVHQMGMPCDLGRIIPIARKHNVFVIEDAACAIGSEIKLDAAWEKIGKPHGDVACFSFHPRKLLTTGDGGMITTRHADWDKKFRLWRQHSMGVPDTVRHKSNQVVFETYDELGYNYRMTDLQAGVGRMQLAKIPAMVSHRREQSARYDALIKDIPGLIPPREPEYARTNWQSYCVRLPDDVDQRTIMQFMLDGGVSSRRGIMNAHAEAAYQQETWSCGVSRSACKCPARICKRLAQSEHAQHHSIILPLYHVMTEAEQHSVVDLLRSALALPTKR